MSDFYDLFPANRRHLLGRITGSSLISEMSEVEFQKMIVDCLTGANPRIITETWAQSKIFHGVFSGLEEMFKAGSKKDENFVSNAPKSAAEFLLHHYNKTARLEPDDVVLCQWICNLTKKGFDNILQGDQENLVDWSDALLASVKAVSYGKLEDNIKNIAIYNASIAKKGGLKSAFGNLFEHLLLFSSLSALGLEYCLPSDLLSTSTPSFALDVKEGRQCDAKIFTCVTDPETISVDIGFIGKGNPEIIADKTQRFANLSDGGQKPLIGTLIIVSALPDEARLVARQASLLGAEVLTMSDNNWISDLSIYLSKKIGIPGVKNISPDAEKAKTQLVEYLPSPHELIERMPRDLEVPSSWINE